MTLARILRLRWLVRAPIWVFRLRLGVLFGGRLLLLAHRGRVSGKTRQVVLEVVEQPDQDTHVVVAGLGPSSQWYRNIRAEPRVRVSVGRHHRTPAQADELEPDQAVEVLDRYHREHPTAYSRLEPVLAEWARQLTSADGDWRRQVPVVALRLSPTTEPRS